MGVAGLRLLDEAIVLDTSEIDAAYLVLTESGKYLRLSPTAFHLARYLKEGRTAEELAAEMSKKGGAPVTPTEVERAISDLTKKLEDAEAKDLAVRGGMWVRRDILPEGAVGSLASLLTWMYRPWAARAALLFTVGMGIVLVAARGQLHPTTTGESLLYAYGLYFLSLFLHELGHAAACSHFGARPSAIGAGIYLVFPVLYSDVSAAWGLTRWQRSVVDLGGIYFQSAVGAVFFAAFMVSGWDPFLLALAGIMGTIAFSLNPILKFDGYWAIADSLGVTNLSQQKTRVLRYFWQTLRGQRPHGLPWPRWLVVVLAAYSLVSFVFIAFFVWHMFPALAQRVVTYPELVWRMLEGIATTGDPPEAKDVKAFVSASFATALACIILWRFGSNLGKSLFAKARGGIARITGARSALATNEKQP